MGNVWGIVKGILDLPNPIVWAIETFGGKYLCEKAESYSSELCQVIDDKPVWFKHGDYIKIALLAIGGLLLFGWFVGPAVFYSAEFFPSIIKIGTEIVDAIKAPFEFVFWCLSWAQGWVSYINDFIEKELGIHREILNALEITGVIIGVTDVLKNLVDYALNQKQNSYFWKIYYFLDKPVDWMQKAWLALFQSQWNPLRYVLLPFFFALKMGIFVLTPVLNFVNPLRWFEKIEEMFK